MIHPSSEVGPAAGVGFGGSIGGWRPSGLGRA
jgi:hypothetical protein